MTPEQGLAALLSDLTVLDDNDAAWLRAVASVPRHLFVPDTIWQVDDSAGGRLVPLHRSDDPERWLRHVYSDEAVETQVDDGRPAPDGTGWEVTSSSSQPHLMVGMLNTLDVEPGMRVLEIGTGTGWNAALLAERVGASNVTTIEIDPMSRHTLAAHSTGPDSVRSPRWSGTGRSAGQRAHRMTG